VKQKEYSFGLDLNYAHLDINPKSSYSFIAFVEKDFVITCEPRTFSCFSRTFSWNISYKIH